jgi:hypothetical protein
VTEQYRWFVGIDVGDRESRNRRVNVSKTSVFSVISNFPAKREALSTAKSAPSHRDRPETRVSADVPASRPLIIASSQQQCCNRAKCRDPDDHDKLWGSPS